MKATIEEIIKSLKDLSLLYLKETDENLGSEKVMFYQLQLSLINAHLMRHSHFDPRVKKVKRCIEKLEELLGLEGYS